MTTIIRPDGIWLCQVHTPTRWDTYYIRINGGRLAAVRYNDGDWHAPDPETSAAVMPRPH